MKNAGLSTAPKRPPPDGEQIVHRGYTLKRGTPPASKQGRCKGITNHDTLTKGGGDLPHPLNKLERKDLNERQ